MYCINCIKYYFLNNKDREETENKFYEKCSQLIDPSLWSESRYHHCLQFFNDNEPVTEER